MKTRKRIKGFTLIEIMIAVAVVGILAAIAIPSYSNYVMRSKLAPGYALLEKARLHIELYNTDNGNVSDVNTGNLEEETDLPAIINSKIFISYIVFPNILGNDANILLITKGDASVPTSLRNKIPFYFKGNFNSAGLLKWECTTLPFSGITVPDSYVPTKCKIP